MPSKTTKLLADKQHVIMLNEKKCKQLLDAGYDGGKKWKEFLEDKIRKEMAKAVLKDLPHQHALSCPGSAFSRACDSGKIRREERV
ncbi:hypothetical protein I315_02896 [Cryptococcus gattii Ru294]|uniref:Uncharacterized protein n=1 Tax=Cryptococcus gattii serotype B (strain WM276 / ATCC MYA-4071) TaxID=367775 RepID=E6RBT5_CRYGW|nr:Hypothetical Protein CGB_I1070C [Cryptococcus gattii WM276]ADV24320.1 Hypothetical Protein CGB_I1070C [Cryptococcus gattii WM276]KIR54414.1 hypothetical protein I315_02896 [Cryptococcus gattii Ru294]KJD99957.1 hypothetical protein I311_06452 [Cryptococcus gattii NT-10]